MKGLFLCVESLLDNGDMMYFVDVVVSMVIQVFVDEKFFAWGRSMHK